MYFKFFYFPWVGRLDFRRLPGPVCDPPRRERERERLFRGMSVGSFSEQWLVIEPIGWAPRMNPSVPFVPFPFGHKSVLF